MSLRTKVKVGNITNLSDARYCAGMGVDMLGFKIGEAEGSLSPIKFKEIAGWVSGPEFVAELPEGSIQSSEVMEGISLIEVPVGNLAALASSQPDQKFMVVLSLNDWQTLRSQLSSHKSRIHYLLVNSLSEFNDAEAKARLADMATEFPLLLGTDLDVNLLDDYLSWPIEGLALNGSEETRPGIKTYDHLSAILEKLEEE